MYKKTELTSTFPSWLSLTGTSTASKPRPVSCVFWIQLVKKKNERKSLGPSFFFSSQRFPAHTRGSVVLLPTAGRGATRRAKLLNHSNTHPPIFCLDLFIPGPIGQTGPQCSAAPTRCSRPPGSAAGHKMEHGWINR